MSCFMTSARTRSDLARRLAFPARLPDSLRETAEKRGLNTAEDWFRALTALNDDSMKNRYGDPPAGDSLLHEEPASEPRILKSVLCLLYQSSESSDEELKRGLADFAGEIERTYPDIRKTPEYETALWG